MPHVIIEHSSDISKNSIIPIGKAIQDIMLSITEGKFDPDQCKVRGHSFDEYLVGKPDHTTSSFLHITIKIMAGRIDEIRKKLAEETAEFTKKFVLEQNLKTTRCDISVDIVEMDSKSYQKMRL